MYIVTELILFCNKGTNGIGYWYEAHHYIFMTCYSSGRTFDFTINEIITHRVNTTEQNIYEFQWASAWLRLANYIYKVTKIPAYENKSTMNT